MTDKRASVRSAELSPGDLTFSLREDEGVPEEVLRFCAGGKVYVRGELVDDNKEIYRAFKEFMEEVSPRGRWCFKTDDDGHRYLIPADEAEEFENLLREAYGEEDFIKFEESFDKYRCSGSIQQYSFLNPRKDL